jgi:hypothetical protein
MISVFGVHHTAAVGMSEMGPTRLETLSRLSLREYTGHGLLFLLRIDLGADACRYCLKDGYGTRLIPQGTITAAHFVRVKSDKVSYVQVTGSGDVRPVLRLSFEDIRRETHPPVDENGSNPQ